MLSDGTNPSVELVQLSKEQSNAVVGEDFFLLASEQTSRILVQSEAALQKDDDYVSIHSVLDDGHCDLPISNSFGDLENAQGVEDDLLLLDVNPRVNLNLPWLSPRRKRPTKERRLSLAGGDRDLVSPQQLKGFHQQLPQRIRAAKISLLMRDGVHIGCPLKLKWTAILVTNF